MDKLRALRYFVKVGETGSFTRTADAFAVPGSSVSRRIRDLENSLGVELFTRTTRNVSLTELGELYFNEIHPLVQALDHADALIGEQSRNPTGRLRITSIPSFGTERLLPALEIFRRTYPDIVIDLDITDKVQDIVKGEVDIAIRSTGNPPESVVARKLSENRYLLVAATEYIENQGLPTTVEDLKRHKAIRYRGPNGPLEWQARRGMDWETLNMPTTFISNSGQALMQAIASASGIALIPVWALEEVLVTGSMQIIDIPETEVTVKGTRNSAVFLLYHRPRYELKKIRVAVDFLIEELKAGM